MPRWLQYLVVVLVVLSWVPWSRDRAGARTRKSTAPRIHIIQDMDNQPKFKAQAAEPAVRRRAGDAAAGRRARWRGASSAPTTRSSAAWSATTDWVEAIPVPVTDAADAARAASASTSTARRATAWPATATAWSPSAPRRCRRAPGRRPSSLHTELVRGRPAGHLFNTITNGIRNMPAYGPQIPVEDRWAIVAYVRALQRSQNAPVEDVPAELRAQLR